MASPPFFHLPSSFCLLSKVALVALGDGFEVALGWLSLGYQQQLAIASSGQRLETPASDATDLGMLELPDGIAARFDLGGGTNCVVTPTALADGNAKMQITVEVTNADGTLRNWARRYSPHALASTALFQSVTG